MNYAFDPRVVDFHPGEMKQNRRAPRRDCNAALIQVQVASLPSIIPSQTLGENSSPIAGAGFCADQTALIPRRTKRPACGDSVDKSKNNNSAMPRYTTTLSYAILRYATPCSQGGSRKTTCPSSVPANKHTAAPSSSLDLTPAPPPTPAKKKRQARLNRRQ